MKTHIYLKWSDEMGESALAWCKDSDLEGMALLDALKDWIGMLQDEYDKEFRAHWDRSDCFRKAGNPTERVQAMIVERKDEIIANLDDNKILKLMRENDPGFKPQP